MRRLLLALARLRWTDWRDLARAQVALVVAQLLVWLRPTGELVQLHAPAATTGGADLVTARRLALAVSRMARVGVVRPRCLVRSMALQRLLEADGIRGSRVAVGVRRDEGRFEAHAWIELDGVVLGDTERFVRRYTALGVARVRDFA